MRQSANPVTADAIAWTPLREGLSMRPLHFQRDGYALHLRIEPGAVIAHHRHTGPVHAFNLSGRREILDTGEIVGPGDYVFEPAGNQDSWRCHGDEPCIVHITLTGRVEYLDDQGGVEGYSDSATARAAYLDHCAALGVAPDPRILGEGADRVEPGRPTPRS